MIIRPFDASKDGDAIQRIWEELHFHDGSNEDHRQALERFSAGSRTLVGELQGQAECAVHTVPGTIQHQQATLSLGIVAAVTTSLVARKQGVASRVTARSVAEDAAAGMITSALGMFEQGFYSRLGFGTGPYEHHVHFNPAHLDIAVSARPPQRLNSDDFEAVHRALRERWLSHGGVVYEPAFVSQAEMSWTENPRGLGYRDESGDLTHFLWGELDDENGPFKITAYAYRDRTQLLELLALLKSLGDQLYLVKMMEPPHAQLQDLISQPFKRATITQGGEYAEYNEAEAYWQLRINDLPACLERTHLQNSDTLSFNLRLHDPIVEFLDEHSPWHGIVGEYSVHLGQDCAAQPGRKPGLPQLEASVNGFSRLWLGCASANAIATAGEIRSEQALLDALDDCIRLPIPRIGWEI